MTRHDYVEQLRKDEAGWHSAAKKWGAVVPLAFGYALVRSRSSSDFETWATAATSAFMFFTVAVFYEGKARRARGELERLQALPEAPGDALPQDWPLPLKPQRRKEIVRGCRWCALGSAFVISMLILLLPPYRVGQSAYVYPAGERLVFDLPRGAQVATDQFLPTLLWITIGAAVFVVAAGFFIPKTKPAKADL